MCAGDQDLLSFELANDEGCQQVCAGDELQFCGGKDHFSAIVATCPPGEYRFGEFCYHPASGPSAYMSIDDNQEACMREVRCFSTS